ncbi:SMC-Scp complex subunit ScpB [Schlesneria paludicola]|uniref:SMC-Scp complex subunit ScpB n=1 Tax=Schlesneria paludicola TaxID=360056 RepID=UPI00029AE3AD|nr:SMC-Scp complex subunit ScpB [Schlesneria paludicola]
MSETEDISNPQDEPDEEMLDLGDGLNPDAGDTSEEMVDWGSDDLEAAYLKAMSALDASDLELPPMMPVKAAREPRRDSESGIPNATEVPADANSETATNESADIASTTAQTIETLVEPIAEFIPPPPAAHSSQAQTPTPEVRLTPRQIIEACLFVGGPALNSKKLVGILRGEFDSEFADREIDSLNRQYAAEGRPYEIRLGEGGYRMALRDEFERIRHKVYGLGPKEVRLSQEALEVLAVVAYHQPIKQAQVEALGKPGCGSVLRQLLRRELLAVERDPAAPREVSYKTTPRFLSLFGIRNLDDLPRHEQVSYK